MDSGEADSISSDCIAEDGEIFEVDRVIDIRWVINDNGREKVEYRVRWKYYKPIDDTWEPPEHFKEECGVVLCDFHKKYEKMKKEVVALLSLRLCVYLCDTPVPVDTFWSRWARPSVRDLRREPKPFGERLRRRGGVQSQVGREDVVKHTAMTLTAVGDGACRVPDF
ncbi:putative M-phase phosphoprotein 8 [Penaeus vannamei]|uniref:Putative M-phase phosphoprotein 8 n=1 Tax=Penaeus vannamei TaxID=6689 RepID=A0A423T4U6_PENVA|nr:putative M-phase phosphoprotein 8 [Penaeus vannamei]